MIPLSVPNLIGKELKYLKKCVDTEFVSSVGSFVTRFERKISNYTKSKYAMAYPILEQVLHLALRVINCKKDNEVIVPTITFAATINPIIYEKARPIFMDCDEYFNLDISKTLNFLRKNTFKKSLHLIKKRKIKL